MSLYVNTSMLFCVYVQFAEATHRPMCVIKTGDLILLGFDAESLGEWLLAFQRIMMPSLSRVKESNLP
jgi:hypothetical protein